MAETVAAVQSIGVCPRNLCPRNLDAAQNRNPCHRNPFRSRPLLPVSRIAAAVETSNDGQRVIQLDDKHERVGKTAKQCAMHVLVDHGELPGSGAHALDHSVNRLAETSA
jgi:hypothetical protein